MRRILVLACLVGAVAVASGVSRADAHGLIGKRFLPATLTIDDPFVADELSLPTVQYFKSRASGEEPATREISLSGELSKRLTPDFGVSLGGTFLILDPQGAPSTSGFDNMEVALKYVFFKNPEHEALVSAGLGWDVGGTGSAKRVGAESFDTVTPSLFFGKGFGDLPDSLEFAKPLALTGVFGVAIPTRHRSRTVEIDEEEGSISVGHELHPNVAKWGFSLQYNLQYLQSFVRDVGLPAPFNRMIPIVELALETPLDRVRAGHTTGTVNPGVIWFGRYVQLGLEALVPINRATGKNIGVVGQVHFYLDDIWPQVFTWTPFHGTLGPTQPR